MGLPSLPAVTKVLYFGVRPRRPRRCRTEAVTDSSAIAGVKPGDVGMVVVVPMVLVVLTVLVIV